jgi:hypothetical protein
VERIPQALRAALLLLLLGAPLSVTRAQDQAPAVYERRLTLLSCAAERLLIETLYKSPHRLAGGIAPDGAISVNADWESRGKTGVWYIEQQRYGADLLQAGVVLKDESLIDQGMKVLEWGFQQQAIDGSFPGVGDPHHSASFFLEAASRSVLLLEQARMEKYLAAAQTWKPKIAAMGRWLNRPEIAEKGRAKALDPYTHRFYLLAAGYSEAAAVTGEAEFQTWAHHYAVDGLSRQQPDGTNPERGGYDASYQGVGVMFASRYYLYCPDEATRTALKTMIAKALDKEMTKIDANGEVSLEGSTRTPLEKGRSGKQKTMDYKVLLMALALGGKITGDPRYQEAAERVARHYQHE